MTTWYITILPQIHDELILSTSKLRVKHVLENSKEYWASIKGKATAPFSSDTFVCDLCQLEAQM